MTNTKFKYYRYISKSDFAPWGKHLIYRISQNNLKNLIDRSYLREVFNRQNRQWYIIGGIDSIPKDYHFLTKKELFLELL